MRRTLTEESFVPTAVQKLFGGSWAWHGRALAGGESGLLPQPHQPIC